MKYLGWGLIGGEFLCWGNNAIFYAWHGYGLWATDHQAIARTSSCCSMIERGVMVIRTDVQPTVRR